MHLDRLQEIERAISDLPPQELAKLYAWLDRHRCAQAIPSEPPAFEEGLGLFGSPDDAALLDEVVHMAYEERRRPPRPLSAL